MPETADVLPYLSGLTTVKAEEIMRRTGKNSFGASPAKKLLKTIGGVLREPMLLLLLLACVLYFLLNEPRQGFLMLLAMTFVVAISVYQEVKSSRALAALKKYNEPKVKCIRDGVSTLILSEELVSGDTILLEEGGRIPADAVVLQSNDLTVNESIVTGESFPVTKDVSANQNLLYQGTIVNSGKCYAQVTQTGNRSLLGRIGVTTASISSAPIPLQQQMGRFVRGMTIFGISAFLLVWLFGYLQTNSMAQSLLLGLTLAMSAIPEEIPVTFSSFLALGAWRMARLGIIVRQALTIENLGAVSVICLDKTGTMTENKMEVSAFYDIRTQTEGGPESRTGLLTSNVLWYARLASETEPFDVMEQAIANACKEGPFAARYQPLHIIHEYPLEGRPPMMTHVYQENGQQLIAAKGGPERILQVCKPESSELARLLQKAAALAAKGYRVLGVASVPAHTGAFPQRQEDFNWQFEGFIALCDPPKENLKEVLSSWMRSGIRVMILSGDHPETVLNIAASAGLPSVSECLTGEKVALLTDQQLRAESRHIDILARMFPEAKLRVIEALKANGETVAMTGDGVNDGPALKAAHIGIAMGDKGTETAREVADLVVSDDDLEKITEAIRQGRSIYENLQKAIRYLITIHIPILTTASLPMLLGWHFPTLFSPIHIIFLELIMGPTCSIFYEREPVEKNIMQKPPRTEQRSILGRGELLLTLLQGLVAASGLLGLYYYFMQHGYSLEYTRTIVFVTLVTDNILLTFVNRSLKETLPSTIRYRNNLVIPVLLLSTFFLTTIILLPAAKDLFGLTTLMPAHLLCGIVVSFLTIGWFEVLKTVRRKPG